MELVKARHRLAHDGLFAYGGDAKVVASRFEIDRVISELSGLEFWLRSQIELQDFATEPVMRLRLALELPPILDRLNLIREACARASDSYFEGETEISRELREPSPLPISNIANGLTAVANRVGLLEESAVTATLVGFSGEVAPPKSLGELASRLISDSEPGPDGKSAWLRIEKFGEPASPVEKARYVVYIPGTQSWGPKTGENPLDLASNLSAISKTGFAGSERAVLDAMKQAGIGQEDSVLLVGHSQGGMVAANISTRFAGSKVLTFGSPLAQLGPELTAPTLSLEHKRDPVPKLDGRPNPAKENWVTVLHELDGTDPMSQHAMVGYLATAKLVDAEAGGKPTLERLRAEITSYAKGASVQTTEGHAYFFELKRVP